MTRRLREETLAAYEHWAPLYQPVAHNPLMRVEEAAMLREWPQVDGRRALDLACGTGRYARLLTESGAAHVAAVDFSAGMLCRASCTARVRANMTQLPFVTHAFDVVISGLAIGHASTLIAWMSEVSRVLAEGGTVLYSDFHPEAAKAGLTRSFKDQNDRTHTVPHRCHSAAAQQLAATEAGLTITAVHEVRVGIELREPFAGSEGFYRQWHGLPIVLVVSARK
jgi:SAM-dependent methyltransferase